MAIYNQMPIAGYQQGSIVSDDAPIKCVEVFSDNRPDNVNYYFKIDGKFYNVHPRSQGSFPVRWIDNSPPIGWKQS